MNSAPTPLQLTLVLQVVRLRSPLLFRQVHQLCRQSLLYPSHLLQLHLHRCLPLLQLLSCGHLLVPLQLRILIVLPVLLDGISLPSITQTLHDLLDIGDDLDYKLSSSLDSFHSSSDLLAISLPTCLRILLYSTHRLSSYETTLPLPFFSLYCPLIYLFVVCGKGPSIRIYSTLSLSLLATLRQSRLSTQCRGCRTVFAHCSYGEIMGAHGLSENVTAPHRLGQRPVSPPTKTERKSELRSLALAGK
jgi:hypothetical protein